MFHLKESAIRKEAAAISKQLTFYVNDTLGSKEKNREWQIPIFDKLAKSSVVCLVMFILYDKFAN